MASDGAMHFYHVILIYLIWFCISSLYQQSYTSNWARLFFTFDCCREIRIGFSLVAMYSIIDVFRWIICQFEWLVSFSRLWRLFKGKKIYGDWWPCVNNLVWRILDNHLTHQNDDFCTLTVGEDMQPTQYRSMFSWFLFLLARPGGKTFYHEVRRDNIFFANSWVGGIFFSGHDLIIANFKYKEKRIIFS